MNKWKFEEYNKVVTSFLAGCSQEMKDSYKQARGILSELGDQCGMPFTRRIEKGLFELRFKDSDSEGRLLFIHEPNRTICFVHAFFKTTEKTSLHDKKIGRRNKKSVEDERRKTYVSNYIH